MVLPTYFLRLIIAVTKAGSDSGPGYLFFQGLHHSYHSRKELAGVALATVTMVGGIGRNGPGNLLSEGIHLSYQVGRDSGPGYLLS